MATATRLSFDEYRRMVDEGIIGKRDRVVLLHGWIVPKMPTNPPHRHAMRKVRAALERVVPLGWFVDEDKPIELRDADSMPEPDVQVVRGDPEVDYPDRHPGPADLGLVVEVADSSLPADRTEMARLYAWSSIPVYWIDNLRDRRIEVHERPSGPVDEPGYAAVRFYGPEEQVPVVLDGREVGRIAVRDLLPREPANPGGGD